MYIEARELYYQLRVIYAPSQYQNLQADLQVRRPLRKKPPKTSLIQFNNASLSLHNLVINIDEA